MTDRSRCIKDSICVILGGIAMLSIFLYRMLYGMEEDGWITRFLYSPVMIVVGAGMIYWGTRLLMDIDRPLD